MTGKWTLYWSPEGRVIAHAVEAKTARAAIRKAPKPYRTYLGEIYAVCENPNAYVAVVRLLSEGYMLGGTRRHVSTPFELESDALAFAKQCVEVNKGLQPTANIRYEIVGVISNNPIKHLEVAG